MQSLKLILIDNDINTIQLFQKFEQEDSVLINKLTLLNDSSKLIEIINEQKPDLIAVNMDLCSFTSALLDDINVHKPKVLFFSSDKSNAYEAFKQNAIDFILYPISFNDLVVTFYKTIKQIEMEKVYQTDNLGKIKSINSLQQNFEYVAIASVDKIELLKTEEIIFCKADGKYTEFYINQKGSLLSSRNLGEYSNLLDNNFFRIHHSYIVNIKYLAKIIKKDGLYCEFTSGHVLPVAKRRQEEFLKYIKL